MLKVDKEDKSKLVWNVIIEDRNAGKIECRNIFNYNWPFRAQLYKAYREYENDFERFSEEAGKALMHEYWCRSEYEVVISPWPSHICKDELMRLNQELEKSENMYPTRKNHFVYPHIPGAIKIDVYDQILMNWNNFINYLWANKHYIKDFKSDYCQYFGVKNYYKKKSK